MSAAKRPQNDSLSKLANNILGYTGISTSGRKPWSSLIVLYHFTVANAFGLCTVLQLLYGKGNTIEFFNSMSAFVFYANTLSKGVNIYLYQTEIQRLIDRLEQFRENIFNNPQKSLNLKDIQHLESVGKKIIVYFNLMCFTCPLCGTISNFIGDCASDFSQVHLIYETWIPWRITGVWTYLLGAMVTLLYGFSSISFFTTFSTLLYAFTFEMSAFLRNIQFRLEIVGPKDTSLFKDHQAVMRLILEYNKIFSGQMYFEVLASSLQPCGLGYALIKLNKYDSGVPDTVFKMILCLCTPYATICACGQEIDTQIEKLHEYSYMSNWYEEKPKVRRDLLQLMTVTVKPIVMNYRGIAKFNNAIFATMMQAFYSYMMMIINIY